MKRVLCVAPHLDDIEWGCGGTVARLIEEGADVHYVAMTDCANDLPPGMTVAERESEGRAALAALGVLKDRIKILHLENKRLEDVRQEILGVLEAARSKIVPNLVFVPCPGDSHQDHVTATNETVRAFRRSPVTMLGYETASTLSMRAEAFAPLQWSHLERKLAALECHQSQRLLNRRYVSQEFVTSLARVRGAPIDADFAEAFQVLKMVVLE